MQAHRHGHHQDPKSWNPVAVDLMDRPRHYPVYRHGGGERGDDGQGRIFRFKLQEAAANGVGAEGGEAEGKVDKDLGGDPAHPPSGWSRLGGHHVTPLCVMGGCMRNTLRF